LKNLKSSRFQPICVFKITKIDNFFSPSQVTEGSGSEIPDFQLEDPDPKLLISDPEHWFIEPCIKRLLVGAKYIYNQQVGADNQRHPQVQNVQELLLAMLLVVAIFTLVPNNTASGVCVLVGAVNVL